MRMVSLMDFRSNGALLWWFAVSAFSVSVAGLGCHHSCDCDFDSGGSDTDVTLRYEVMSGLVGAFAPLTLAGLGFLTYKLCSRPPMGAPSLPAGGMAPAPTSYPGSGWRGEGGGFKGNSLPSGREPTSLYGESDDDIPSQSDKQRQDYPGGRGHTSNSRFTNIHRNVKDDMTNQWLRSVNTRKY
ncbi:hypothetical protein EGW08_004932 [Elysia chlorotica]|uniref:Uncharacterized protein n=1 Tax=Elysia chlorotica TaxID=188477 RepID=A0A3S1A060_ELYCH|nr:hypothetical protein EGW08_004932 [Elysia chlorotica]